VRALLYAESAARILPRTRGKRRGSGMLFVVGSPRSGTTFLASALGEQRDVVDLGEVHAHKASIPELAALPVDEAAARLRRTLERVRTLALARRLRGVEQTPETAFVLPAALRAYPEARVLHLIRDGRDVVCSLLERGWLSATRGGVDDAGLPLGPQPRFWVEAERRQEFRTASEARRAAWVWRSYVSAARGVRDERIVELRYEELADAAGRLAPELGLDEGTLAASLGKMFDRSVGRWRRELDAEQLADVEAEAGPLLAELGY
jgi:Sulfotransferase family